MPQGGAPTACCGRPAPLPPARLCGWRCRGLGAGAQGRWARTPTTQPCLPSTPSHLTWPAARPGTCSCPSTSPPSTRGERARSRHTSSRWAPRMARCLRAANAHKRAPGLPAQQAGVRCHYMRPSSADVPHVLLPPTHIVLMGRTRAPACSTWRSRQTTSCTHSRECAVGALCCVQLQRCL